MIREESQAALTFYSRGALISKGVEILADGKVIKNAAKKAEINKITAFAGAIDPDTGKFDRLLNVDWYIKNKKPFPKKYYWSKSPYVEPTYGIVTRKLHWEWEQIKDMLNTPVMLNDKQWKKLSDEQKIELHAKQCMAPDEYDVEIEFVI